VKVFLSIGPPQDIPPADGPLPRGRHGLPRELVERHQHERLVGAVASALAEHGYEGLTVGRITGEARVSRTTFYRHFTDKREAVLAAHKLIFDDFFARLQRACAAAEQWPRKVGATIAAALDFAAAQPAQARLLISQFDTAEQELARTVRNSHDRLAALLTEGRQHYPAAATLPELTEQALVGALTAVFARSLETDEPTPSLHAQLTELALVPYLGPAQAADAVATLT
jgi:AcrR family transcriptional regulator